MRIEGKRYRDEWLPNFYPSRELAPDRWLRISRTGKTVVLSAAEDRQISEIYMDAPLYERLERTGHILTPDEFDMSPETARAVVEFAMSSPNSRVCFEFQGGEPFLNFAAIRAVVEHAEAINRAAGKELVFSAVTNLMIARDEHLAFCRDHDIRVSYTVNGPEAIHDYYRRTGKGTGSFAGVMRRLTQVQERFPDILSATPLCVIDDYSAPRLKEMIDFYFDEGFNGVGLIRLKPLGFARKGELKFGIARFMEAYLGGLQYILDKNKTSGRAFLEYMVPVVLAKILGESDTGFVDWRNPCGDISGAIIYDYDGEILPVDEARSMRDVFALGNVRSVTYEELMRGKDTFRTMNLSLRDRDATCRECAYKPYCDVNPVLEYARTGSLEPRPHESDDCLYTLSLLDWTFKKLLEDPLPLMLMVPSMGEHMGELLERAATPA